MSRSIIISTLGHLALIASLFVLALIAPMKPEPEKLLMNIQLSPPPPPPSQVVEPPPPEPEKKPEKKIEPKTSEKNKETLAKEWEVVEALTPTPTPTPTPEKTPKPEPTKKEEKEEEPPPKRTVTPKPTIFFTPPPSTPKPAQTAAPQPAVSLPASVASQVDVGSIPSLIDHGAMSTDGSTWEQGAAYAGQALRKIQINFHPSHSRPVRCTVRFRVLRDGTIEMSTIKVIDSTGLPELDSSAVQALKDTASLPELYQSFNKPYMEVDVVFNFDKTF